MPLPDSIAALVAMARRRLLISGMTHLAVLAVGVTAGLAAVIVAIARFVVWPWAEPVAAGAVAASVLVAAVIAWMRRPSPARAALAVDRRLGGFDRVSTALELSARPPRKPDRQEPATSTLSTIARSKPPPLGPSIGLSTASAGCFHPARCRGWR